MNAVRCRTVFDQDFRLNLRRPLFWFLLAILALMSWGLSRGAVTISSGDSAIGGNRAWLTSEFAMAFMFPAVVMLVYAFFMAVAAGMVVPSDDELRVGEVLHATRLEPREYIWSKFSAVLSAYFVILVLHLVLQMLFNHLWPNPDAEKIRGPFALVNYLRPTLVMAVPTVFFFCGVSFAIGELTRRPILVYLFPTSVLLVCLFFLFDWSPTWLDPKINRILMWIEPSGYRWLNETWLKLDRGLEFYNKAAVGYDVPFLLSRLGYAVVGLGSVAFAERHFARALRGRVRVREGKAAGAAAAERAGVADALRMPALASLGMRSAVPRFLGSALDVARFEVRNLRGQAGLYLFVPIILLQIVPPMVFRTGAFDTPLLLTPGIAASMSMGSLAFLVCMLLMFYTVESILRERNTGFAPIYYATPVPTAAILFGKALANSFVGIVVMAAAMLGALGVMVFQGKVAFDPVPFLVLWGVLLVPTFLVWSAFIAATLSATGSRYSTYAIGLAVVVLTTWLRFRGKLTWVGNWPLSQAVSWTDFGGVAPNTEAVFWNRLFYISILVFLIAVSVRLFWRREHDGSRVVERLTLASMWARSRWIFLYALVPIAIGIFLQVQVSRGFQSKGVENREKEYWGRNLTTWLEAETPLIARADIDVTLEPDAHRFEVTGSYRLTNPSTKPMTRFPMSAGRHFENMEWTLEGEEAKPEDHARLFVFTPEEPLLPGDTLEVGFSHDGTLPMGFTKNGGGLSEFVLPIGVVLTSFGSTFVPVPYFEEGRGVTRDNRTDPKDYPEGFYEGVTLPAFGGGSRFPVRTRITGPADFVFNGVGVKTSEEEHDGLRTVTWETDHPVNFFNVVGGKWKTREGEGTVIHHLAKHTYNVEEMGQALDAARKYYSEWFYPYPWAELKLSEFPALAGYAQGFPTNITFSENIGFLTRSSDKARAAFVVTAHEAAHQWWGNILLPGKGPGGNILSEGMAHFSTILLTEEVHGPKGRIEFCKRIEETYGDSRQVDSEKPLVWIDGSKAGDTTVTYDKGGWVFWMLLQEMGREANLAGIQAFIGRYATDRDHAVLQDFVREMRPFAPDTTAYDAFTRQWFFEVVVPEYKIHDAKKTQEGGGWVVRGEVENVGTGLMEVQIAASVGERFQEPEKSPGQSPAGSDSLDAPKPYEESRVSVTLGPGDRQPIEIPCSFEPARVVVDPDAVVFQLDRDSAEEAL